MIRQLCEATELPVNIIALPGTPDSATLAKLGVARISYGPVPYRQMIAWLTEQARQVIGYAG
jgi:2-methylisocitrate lyase-like PEP mutase family enzyme